MTTRCVECRKPVIPGDERVERQGPSGRGVRASFREITNTWHAKCWREVEAFAARSRERAESERQQVVRELAAELGLPDPFDAARAAS